MVETNTGTVMGHQESVAYVDELVAADQIDPTEWEAWVEPDDDGRHYYVRGPCPRCRAEVQGHALDSAKGPTEAQGGDRSISESEHPAVTVVEVPVACTCGFDHGNDASRSCGRRWLLELSKEGT